MIEREAGGGGIVGKKHFVVVFARCLANDFGIAVLNGDGKVGDSLLVNVQVANARLVAYRFSADIEVPVAATFLKGDNSWLAEGHVVSVKRSAGNIDILLG